MKFIIVTGGVCSGVGKGIVTSSIGALLKGCGLNVTAIKIDPYWNPDAGLMSPREHGEVFVMDDGGEVDLDLGNYERYLDTTMTKMNNITTGKLSQGIYENERKGYYLGQTVRTVPDVTQYIMDWIRKTAIKAKADICLIELGGTIGDIEGVNFIEALRTLKFREKYKDVVIIEVDLVVELFGQPGELKTKPCQLAIKNSRQSGLAPKILICRTRYEMNEEALEKLSISAEIPRERIFNLIQLGSVYQVPCFLEERGILRELSELVGLNLKISHESLSKWRQISDTSVNARSIINIALVGKYVQWPDTYTSISKALEHACYSIGAKPKLLMVSSEDLEVGDEDNDAWKLLKTCSGLIVPGGFDNRGTNGMLKAIKWARENKVPYLGICLGFQLAVLEHAKNVVGIDDASSEEFSPVKGRLMIIEMLEYQDPERKLGGTMRLGLKRANFTKPSILRDLYNSDTINERHRHRYEVNPQYVPALEVSNFKFVAQNDDGTRMEILELEPHVHPYFVGVQFHPEYLSRPFKPSPPFIGLIKAASNFSNECSD